MKKKPVVVHVAWHCCVRVLKQALAEIAKGYEVHLITGMLPITYNKFSTVSFYCIGEWYKGTFSPAIHQLANAVKMLSDKADIFHVHNEPDWIACVVGENKGKAKMVWDIHDLTSIRSHKEEPDERRAIELSDGMITISEPYRKHIVELYKYEKPSQTVHSCVPEHLYVNKPLSHIDGIVYEGGVNPVISTINFLPYRNFAGFLKWCNEHNIDFHLFPADPQFDYSYYRENGANLYPSKPFHLLMQELSRFDFGFAGTPVPDPEFGGAMPNKIFEYAAAGLPSMVFNATTAGEFVEKEGLGVWAKSIDDVKRFFENKNEYKEKCVKNRWNWTMEREVEKTESLYEKVA